MLVEPRAMIHHLRDLRKLGTLLVLLAAGCGRCSDEPRVPFKLARPGGHQDAAFDDDRADAAVEAAHVFTPPVDRPLLEGAPVALMKVHAALERDLDGDGDRDALVLTEDEQQQPRLSLLTRAPTGFGMPIEVSPQAAQSAPGCVLSSAHFTVLSATKAVATIERACSADATATTPRTSLWLLSLDAAPRVYERLDVLDPGPGLSPSLALAASSVDADGDGHDDVALTVTTPGADDALKLVWLDRPSGLARDLREPDATLTAWAAAASSLLAKEPEQAIARAELALSLARALCRELGAPTIELSGSAGVPCGPLKSSGQLLVTLVTAHAKRGAIGAAFDAYRALRRLEPAPPDKLLAQASSALLSLKPEPQITLRKGPGLTPLRTPRVHLPSARFVSESLLYLRRARPILYDVEGGEETPASPGEELLHDPSGQLVATAIERTCEGHAVRIERAPPRGSDYVSAPALTLALLAPAASPPGCSRASTRPDDGGFTLLGWAPQGLLAARGSDLRLVPLSTDGHALGAPRPLAPDAPRPAPITAGVATADAARYVEPTPHGLLLYGPSSTRVELWRPEGYTAIAKGPLEAAVSPSARRIALVAGEDVYLLERTPSR